MKNGTEKVAHKPSLENFPKWPHYDEDEIEAVAGVLRSGKVNQWTGHVIEQFETSFANQFQQPFAIALANGSLALELALLTAGIGEGDEVIVTPRSFIASVSSVALCGATPVFADIDPLSQNITPSSIEAVLSDKTRAVIPVHLNGLPADMPGIMALAKNYNLYVIEDCAQAHGAKINGRPVGSFGEAAAFSFCQDKIMSTGGEGGMLLLKMEEDWKKSWSYKDHGKNYDTVKQDHPPGFRWLHESFGSNWRMTEMQAAIGLRQLEKLPHWLDRRKAIAESLNEHLRGFAGITVPVHDKKIEPAWYRFSFHVEEDKLKPGWNRRKLMGAIQNEGIPCLEICPEIYLEKAFANLDFPEPNCPVAHRLGNEVCVLLTHPTINDEALEKMLAGLKNVLTEVCG